jgi:SAM-dependent methyltransferase
MLAWLSGLSPKKVLDLGCSSGLLASQVQLFGHEVTGVDMIEFPDAFHRMDHFFQANLDEGIPKRVGKGYDGVIAGDILEHVRHPDLILQQIGERLTPEGFALVSIPSFSHWYPRFRVASGRFDYEEYGILDRGHIRFFTQRSFEHLIFASGLRIERMEAIGIPFEHVLRTHSQVAKWMARLDRLALKVYPSLFAYQYLFKLVVGGMASE